MANENLKKMLPPRVPYDRYGKGFNDCLDQIDDLFDEIDLVEVVRCKDCLYWQDNNGGYPHEDCRWGKDETPDADDFCSYGERKSADNPKITCLNCKHFMFSDMYGECNKLFRIVHPSDTCEYAELKEKGR